MSNKPEYIAKRSAWTVCHFWEFLVFWLLVPTVLFFTALTALDQTMAIIIAAAWYAFMILILVCRIIKIIKDP